MLVTFVQLVIPVGLIALIGGLQILVDRLSTENSSDEPDFYGKVEISRFLPAADAKCVPLLAAQIDAA